MLKLLTSSLLLAYAFSIPASEVLRQHLKVLILTSASSKVETLRVAIQDNPEQAVEAVAGLFPFILSKMDSNNNGKIDEEDATKAHQEIMDYYRKYVAGSFVDYEVEPDLQEFLKMDANGDGELDVQELQSLVVTDTQSPLWNMVMQYFVQQFDTEDTFKGYLTPSEMDKVSESILESFMKLDHRINKTVKQPEEPLPPKTTEEVENAVDVEEDFVADESVGAHFLRMRMKTLQFPMEFAKNLMMGWEDLVGVVDANKNGYIDQADLDSVWSKVKAYYDTHIKSRKISAGLVQSPEEWFQAADVDENGRIDLNEYKALIMKEGEPGAHAFCMLVCAYVDENSDGFLSTQEKSNILASPIAPMIQLRPRSIGETRIADDQMEQSGKAVVPPEEISGKDEMLIVEMPEIETDDDEFTPEQLKENLITVINKMEILRMRFARPGNLPQISQIIRENFDEIVDTVDINKDGVVSSEELAQTWQLIKDYMDGPLGRSGHMVDREVWMQGLGAQPDGSVRLSPEKLIQIWTQDLQGRMWESLTACIFYFVDADKDGSLSRAELKAFEASDLYRLFDLPAAKPE